MIKTIGSNIKDRDEANAATATYATEIQPDGSEQSTFLTATPSARKNTEVTTRPLNDLEREYQPPVFEPPLPVTSLPAANLPYPILNAIRHAFPTAHFVAVAPNTTTCLITTETIADLPPGYVVTMVFDPVDGAGLPPKHQDGTIYIVPPAKP